MTQSQQLMKYVKALVADETSAVDFETGLCRYCDRVVEAFDTDEIQGHGPSCPWKRVRQLVGAA
jgi:hypothetical protein